MKDITVLIPLHRIDSNYIEMLQQAVNNVESMQYDGNVNIMVVLGGGYDYPGIDSKNPIRFVSNPGPTDYCSQINFGVSQVETEYFSIMEVDDRYNAKWFTMFDTYLNTNEDVSVFLPINVVHRTNTSEREFVNDMIWAASFSEEIGYIDFKSLMFSASFNLTGGIFKTSDWLGYKPSIKVAFNYEYLLRATSKNHNQKIFVVPKEGYYHELFREGSLVESYMNDISDEDTVKWFELAKREYAYDEDRNKDIISVSQEELR